MAEQATLTNDLTSVEAAVRSLDESRSLLSARLTTLFDSAALATEETAVAAAVSSFIASARLGAVGQLTPAGVQQAELSALVALDELAAAAEDAGGGSGSGAPPLSSLAALAFSVAGGLVIVIAFVVMHDRFARLRGDAEVAEQRLLDVSEDLNYLVYETDRRGRLTFITNASQRLLGFRPSEMIGRPLASFVADADVPNPRRHRRRGEYAEATQHLWRRKDGSLRRLEVIGRRLGGRRGRAMRGIARDIGDRLAAEEALHENQRAFVDMLQTAQNGFVIVAPTGEILLFNVALCEMLGYQPDEMRLLAIGDLMAPDHVEPVLELIAERTTAGDGSGRYEGQAVRRDGTVRDIEMSISFYRAGSDAATALVEVNDVTDRNIATARIQHMADFDQLTGLPNRYQLDRAIADAVTSPRDGAMVRAVMVIDLDRFKIVNDTLGHLAGDALLRRVARRIRDALPAQYLIGRLGGDEFLMLTPLLDDADAVADAARMLVEALKEPFDLDGHEVHVNASIGVSVYPDDGLDSETLIRHADSAMYRAKQVGGSGFQFSSPAFNEEMRGQLALESGLRRAIEEGQFVVYYQPEVEAGTGRIRAMEALLRWDHPEQGIIAPTVFIPMLEETGLISQVGEWVLRTAVEQSQRWQLAGLPTVIAVNVSTQQLMDREFGSRLQGILKDAGLAPEWIELEVTESDALNDLNDGIATLRELRDLGLQTAIDDFGTGHSSLVRLRELPVGALKIDRSFVAGIENEGDDAEIVAGVIALGHALKLMVIAEGVETMAQLTTLEALGCDVLQGFLFAQPLPAAEAGELLRNGIQGIRWSAA